MSLGEEKYSYIRVFRKVLIPQKVVVVVEVYKERERGRGEIREFIVKKIVFNKLRKNFKSITLLLIFFFQYNNML